MPIPSFPGLTQLAKPLTSEEGRRILERDHYRCQYCGLDGNSRFEDSLIMTVDFVHPRAHKGKKTPTNLVTACRPCNVIKGRHVFKSFDEAKAYILKRRKEFRESWEAKTARQRSQSAAGSL